MLLPSESEDQVHYGHILAAVQDSPWAILESKLTAIVDLVALRAAGRHLDPEQIRLRIGAVRQQSGSARQQGSVAVLPLMGTLIPRADLITESSGATSLERWTANFRQAVADPNVSAVIIDVDSPGGSVYGVEEAAAAVRAARGSKPIVAVANSMAASAAYWIASAADELVVTPSGEVGSIGVIAVHDDLSVALEKAGVKVSLITAGKYKAEQNPFQPLGVEARADIQSRVNDYYGAFTRAVGTGRGVSATAVRDGYGQGRMVGARQAVTLGMADQVATLDETIVRVASGRRLATGRAAAALTTPLHRAALPAPRPDFDIRRRRLRRLALS